MDAAPTPIVVQNIRAAYSALQYRVQRALQTQLGDRYRLGIHRRECTSLLSDITGHSHLGIIPANEQAVMESGIYDMLDALNSATGASSDQPDGPPASFGARVLSGRPGRPRVDIDPEDLSLLATGRTRNTDLAVIPWGSSFLRRRCF
ncbi:hypothetical protein EDB89DRAFT_553766 [Lactarius sanguifluus]|nr:hypothetical protein EDB89DRAFT_553766 [Lactarius sanguifluus]